MKEQTYNVENTRAQMRKGTLDISILLIISEGRVYAGEIITKLIDANIMVVEGTLYPLLSRLKRIGLVSYEWKESKVGPPRKYYFLTAEGKNVLKRLCKTWTEFNKSINTLIKKYEKSN
ncbi:MAG: PadR family transcriptional regulator [Candidatus Magasanikbacteria bacterium]